MDVLKKKILGIEEEMEAMEAYGVLFWAIEELGVENIALASSMSVEDQVLTDMILGINSEATVFTLDTGRLPQETYDVIEATRKRYHTNIEMLFPDKGEVEVMVEAKGPNLFYSSIANRKMCCNVRKVEPLRRKLAELDVWVCGLRREQAVTRTEIPKVEWDDANGLVKLNPLADWTEKQVWDYVHDNHVPYNKLHDHGYPSIGCMPCTRAIEKGEDVRAGRWWWESPESKECGLHVQDGKLVRG